VIFRANVSKYFIHGAYGNDFEYDFGELVGDEGHVIFLAHCFAANETGPHIARGVM